MYPKMLIFVARWGGWPSFTPLLIKSIAANDLVEFMLLGETKPEGLPLPRNVAFMQLTLQDLTSRLRATVGLRLETLNVQGRAGGWSSAKVNDLKPMFGEAFADVLRGYEWWGYMQEDVILGRLQTVCLRPITLQRHDIITPFNSPMNSSGIFMLYRNRPEINRLWRKSSEAKAILSDPEYWIFDEWWGKSKDNMAVLIGREVDAKRLRLSRGSALWYGSDNRPAHEQVVCWHEGAAYATSKTSGTERMPCLGTDKLALANTSLNARERAGVCIFHLAETKKERSIWNLKFDQTQYAAMLRTAEFALTRHGLWLPAHTFDPSRPAEADEGAYMLVSGNTRMGMKTSSVDRFEPQTLRLYLARLRRCIDAAALPRVREHLRLGHGWCNRIVGPKCKFSEKVKTLCMRSCNLCSLD